MKKHLSRIFFLVSEKLLIYKIFCTAKMGSGEENKMGSELFKK
jgi:hypothetical protein